MKICGKRVSYNEESCCQKEQETTVPCDWQLGREWVQRAKPEPTQSRELLRMNTAANLTAHRTAHLPSPAFTRESKFVNGICLASLQYSSE